MSPVGPGYEPELPPESAGEWRVHCPQGTWAWGGGSGLGSWESGQLSAQGPSKDIGKAKRYSPSPSPKACPPPPGWQGRGPENIRQEWVGSRQVSRNEAEPADEAAPSSQRGQWPWLQLPRARGPSDVLNPDWAGVRGRVGSLGGTWAGSSLGTSHLLPGRPLAPNAPRSYKG